MSPKLWKWCKVAQASFYYFSLNHYLISYSNQASGEFERMDLNFILSQKKSAFWQNITTAMNQQKAQS